MEPRGNVQRHHHRIVRIDRRHRFCKRATNLALETAAKYRVDQQFCLRVEFACPWRHTTASSDKILMSHRRIA